MAGLGETAKEDDGFRSREGYEISQFLTEQAAGKLEDLLSHFITSFSCFEYVIRSDMVDIQIAEERLFRRIGYNLLSRTSHTRCRSISLDATLLTATTLTSFRTVHNLGMTKFASETIMTINDLSIDYDT